MTDRIPLEKEDYTDPVCPFCTEQYDKTPRARRIPLSRVLEKLDAYFAKNDYDGACKHLLYWREEARLGGDDGGELALTGELMGLYRKTGKRDEALQAVREAVSLCEKMGVTEESAGGTAYLNAGTVYKAFGLSGEALPYFAHAAKVYEATLAPDDPRMGGLYNNMALAYVDEKRFAEAFDCYEKALAVMAHAENGELEQAITCLNMANACEAQYGLESAADAIEKYLAKAETLLRTPTIPRNGYYAFVAGKCSPTFSYYGWFAFARELEKTAAELYRR